MSDAVDTQSREHSTEQVTTADPAAPPNELTVTTRLLNAEADHYPYTMIRDWIALLPQSHLSDGAYRLYCISRSVIFENAKGGVPPKPTMDISYEEYAAMLGRSAKTISRFARDLFAAGLWEEVERGARSVTVPGKARPQIRTILTIRVHDYPHEPHTYDGPRKTWDVLSDIRETKRRARADGINLPGQTVATNLSAQSDQGKRAEPGAVAHETSEDQSADPVTDVTDTAVSAGQCDRTNMTTRTDLPEQASPPETQDQGHPETTLSPAKIGETAGQSVRTNLSAPKTDLSAADGITAGQPACEGSLKKTREKEQPSLPPHPPSSATPTQTSPDTLADELAMFSADAIVLVGELYEAALTIPEARPLSPEERAGLARRIDARLGEGWSLTRVRRVLTNGTLEGAKLPGSLWAKRLDSMPAYLAGTAAHRQATSSGSPAPSSTRPAPSVHRGGANVAARVRTRTHDTSDLPDPNSGKVRYEVPGGHSRRMAVRWADVRTAGAWCGRCALDSRTLRPHEPGALPRPCPECHPEPGAFPDPASEPAHTVSAAGCDPQPAN